MYVVQVVDWLVGGEVEMEMEITLLIQGSPEMAMCEI